MCKTPVSSTAAKGEAWAWLPMPDTQASVATDLLLQRTSDGMLM